MATARKSSSKARPKRASKRARAATRSSKRGSASPARGKTAGKTRRTRAAKPATPRRASSTKAAKTKRMKPTASGRKGTRPAKLSSKKAVRPASKTRVAARAGSAPTPDAPPRRKKLRSDVEEPEGIMPAQQSQKGPFDSRLERTRDQDQAASIVNRNEKFSEEDWLTNKTGDPRIGTKGRTYEP